MIDAHRSSTISIREPSVRRRADQIVRDLVTTGYHVLPEPAHSNAVAAVLRELPTFARRRTLLNERTPEPTWDEIAVPLESLTARTIFPREIKILLSTHFGRLSSYVCWVNHYGVGEWIPPHTDTQGDLQIVMTLALPPAGLGGRLRLCHERWSEIPLGVGERMIFEARKTPHSTTAVLPNDETEHPPNCRVIGVCRLFFERGNRE